MTPWINVHPVIIFLSKMELCGWQRSRFTRISSMEISFQIMGKFNDG